MMFGMKNYKPESPFSAHLLETNGNYTYTIPSSSILRPSSLLRASIEN